MSLNLHDPLLAATAPDHHFLPTARQVGTGRGVYWLAEGWELFLQAPGRWMLNVLASVGIYLLLSLIPVLGGLLSMMIAPVLMAGLMALAHGLHTRSGFLTTPILAGFHHQRSNLILLGLAYLLMLFVAILATMLLGMLLSGSENITSLASHQGPPDGEQVLTLTLLVLLFTAFLLPLIMAYWFAPMLVFFSGLSPWQALKSSLLASLRNWLPLLVYGLVMTLAALVFMLISGLITWLGTWFSPLTLALSLPLLAAACLASYAVILASTYLSFKDLFGSSGNNQME